MNGVQIKNQRVSAYEINKNYLSCFDDTVYIFDSGIDTLALGVWS